MHDHGRIFGIGLRKTGTRSLASATRILGFRTFHKGGDGSSNDVVRAATEGAPLLRYLGTGFDAYFDVEALVQRFAEVDAQYPGSRFILTTRDEEAWLASLERHVRANQQRQASGEWHGSLVEVDHDRWRAERAAHHAAVDAHFADRPDDLLVVDLCSGTEGWERLAPFLGRPVPRAAFPWENRAGAGTYRPEPQVAALRRRAAGLRGRLRRLAA